MRLLPPVCVALLILTGFCPVQAPGDMVGNASSTGKTAPIAAIPIVSPKTSADLVPLPPAMGEPSSPAVTAAPWMPEPTLAHPPSTPETASRSSPDDPAGLPLNPRLTVTGEVRGLMRLFGDAQDQAANRQPLHVGVGLRYTF